MAVEAAICHAPQDNKTSENIFLNIGLFLLPNVNTEKCYDGKPVGFMKKILSNIETT